MSDSTQGTLSNISGSIYLDGAKHESKQIKQRHIKNKEILKISQLKENEPIFIVNEKKEGASCITTHLRLS